MKNKLKGVGHDVKGLEQAIQKLESDYGNYYANIRDYLTAHREDLDLYSRLTLWHDIDLASVEVLVSDAEQILSNLYALEPSVGAYTKPDEIDNHEVLAALLTCHPSNEVTIGMDDLALSRPNTLSIIPKNEFQTRASQVVSCYDLAKRQLNLLNKVELLTCPILKQTLIASVILDLVNLIEDLFGLPGRTCRNKPFVEIAVEYESQGSELLKDRAKTLDKDECDSLVDVRNRACAHYDTNTPIANIVEELENIDHKELEESLESFSKAFSEACSQDEGIIGYTIHGESVEGVSSIQPTGLEKPFA